MISQFRTPQINNMARFSQFNAASQNNVKQSKDALMKLAGFGLKPIPEKEENFTIKSTAKQTKGIKRTLMNFEKR